MFKNGGGMMNVTIIGAGAIGMLCASFLAEEKMQVTVIARKNEQVEQIRKMGLLRKNLDETLSKVEVLAATNIYNITKDTLVIVAVKYGDLKNLYPIIESLDVETPLLFLQNGLAHFEEILQLPQNTIAFGSCQFGAQKENDYTVIHRGQGVLKLAIERGENQHFHKFYEIKNEQFQIKVEENAEQMLFEKALINCFINPLTAILNVKNGKLIENRHSKSLLETLYFELMEAFPEEKERFLLEDVFRLCEKTSSNTSSMLADRLMNRPTEIETIVGAILKKASKRGKSVPTLSTLYHLLLVLEESGDKM